TRAGGGQPGVQMCAFDEDRRNRGYRELGRHQWNRVRRSALMAFWGGVGGVRMTHRDPPASARGRRECHCCNFGCTPIAGWGSRDSKNLVTTYSNLPATID